VEKIYAFGICLYKKRKDCIEILLCKSVNSKEKWGFLKGVALKYETQIETALREFYEESGIKIEANLLENFFIQKNELKDIGVFLVDFDNVHGINKYFKENKLYKEYLSDENSDVEFFNIDKLPLIKSKQKYMVNDIVNYLDFK